MLASRSNRWFFASCLVKSSGSQGLQKSQISLNLRTIAQSGLS